ncbi:MAG: SAM-dependent chlorinase/fluorinase [Ilumatobacteraceae bacterium]
MTRRYDTVSLLTDLGSRDEAAGVVRAVLHDLAPHARVIDLTHDIDPFDVRAGALALVRAIAYVPAGVVLASIDPGAGTERRAIAVEIAGGEGVVIGPDNGLLAPAIALTGGAERAVLLTNPAFHLEAPSPTFAARDVFAPVAAHLCNGVPFDELGEPVDPAILLPSVIPLPRTEAIDGVMGLECEVLWVDRYGNAQLNVGSDEVAEAFGDRWTTVDEARFQVVIGEDTRVAVIRRSFLGGGTGAVGLVLDSSGMYALAMEEYSAAGELRLGVTDRVRLVPLAVEPAPPGAPIEGPVTTPVQLGRRPAP